MSGSFRSRDRRCCAQKLTFRTAETFTSAHRCGIIVRNGVGQFITEHWIDVLQSIGIVAGLFTTAYTLHEEAEARRVTNLFTVTKHHREIWTFVIEKPELSRVLDAHADLTRSPVTESERLFVRFLILHLATAFEARKRRMFFTEEGLKRDMREFFRLPIPCDVWAGVRGYQRQDFVHFVDDAISGCEEIGG
jgi:hypothetical protein